MRRSNTWIVFGGALLFVVVCLFCHERHLSGRDTSNFVLAIRYGYSVVQDRPHAPGYPAFYVLWKCIQWLSAWPPHRILLVTNVAFALAAFFLTYVSARRWAGERIARIAALLVLTNPLLLYFTNTTELYAYDAAYSAFLVWLLVVSEASFWPYAIYGLLASFRLSSFILTVPVVVIVVALRALDSRNLKQLLLALLGIATGFALWFIPFLLYIGGWDAFRRIMEIADGYPGFAPVLNLLSFGETTVWSLNILILILLWNSRRMFEYLRANFRDRQFLALVLLVGVPGCFFAFRYSTKGYTLLCLAPLALLAAWVIEKNSRPQLLSAVAIAMNLLVFFGAPFYAPSARSVLAHDVRTNSERWHSAVLRGTSWFLSSNSHLRASDAAATEALTLLDAVRPGATVLVDASAGIWMYDRCIVAERPQYTTLGNFSDGHLEWYKEGSVNVTFSAHDLDTLTPFYELTTRELAPEFSSILTPVSQSAQFSLFRVPLQQRAVFFQKLDSLYVRKKQSN